MAPRWVEATRRTKLGRADGGEDRAARPGSKILCVVLAAMSLVFVGSKGERRAERQRYIEQMTAAEKSDLARKQERFNQLSTPVQQRLRDLNERLEREPDVESLREVMRAYCDWLDTLPQAARDRLQDLPVDERMERIKEKRYGPQDAKAIREWCWSYLRERNAHREEPPGPRPNGGAQPVRAQAVSVRAQALWGMPRETEKAVPYLLQHVGLATADLAPLRARLSKATAEDFDRKSEEKQREWVALQIVEMLRQMSRQRFRGGPPEQVTDEQLATFYESDSLTDENRDELMRMSGKEMYDKLRRWYHLEHSWRPPEGRRPRGESSRRGAPPWLDDSGKPRNPTRDAARDEDSRRNGRSGRDGQRRADAPAGPGAGRPRPDKDNSGPDQSLPGKLVPAEGLPGAKPKDR